MTTQTETPVPKKRPLISLPFIIVAGGLAIAAYYAGPSVMTQVMYWQERAIANAPVEMRYEIDNKVDDGSTDSGGGGAPGGGGGAPGGGGGAPGGGAGFDPAALFAERDGDGNGKLEGDEISERMQGRLEQIDTDADGAISQAEFLAGVRGGRPGGAGGGEGGPGSREGRSGRPPSDNAITPPSAEEPPAETSVEETASDAPPKDEN